MTPTQELIGEVLAARHRMGEPHWPLSTRFTHAAKEMEQAGLVHTMSGLVEKTFRASLTDAGRAEFLGDGYQPPLDAARAENRFLGAQLRDARQAIEHLSAQVTRLTTELAGSEQRGDQWKDSVFAAETEVARLTRQRDDALNAARKAIDAMPDCDAGCRPDDGPVEDCSLHGRPVREVWGIVQQVQSQRDGLAELVATFQGDVKRAETERDRLASVVARVFERSAEPDPLAEENARLRRAIEAVEALCDEMSHGEHWQTWGVPVVAVARVRAALAGEAASDDDA